MIQRSKKTLGAVWDKALVLVGVLGVLVPCSPWNMALSSRDSGVFLYTGWRIVAGKIPYVHIWDHKPPVIFYLNALGLRLTPDSRWGVWFIEVVFLYLAAYFGFRMIRKAFGEIPAVLSLVLWLLTLISVLNGGNFTTEYTLLFQFATLWLIFNEKRLGSKFLYWFVVGLLGGFAFMTKQTVIGLWMAVAIYITIRSFRNKSWRKWLREMSFFVMGGLSVILAFTLYFYFQGGLEEFIDAAFRYNFIYSTVETGIRSHVYPMLTGISQISGMGLFQLGMMGYFAALIFLISKRGGNEAWKPLLIIGLINLPIELLLVSVSGRTYPHYYMTLLPVLMLFSSFLFNILQKEILNWKLPKFALISLVIGMIISMGWAGLSRYIYVFTSLHDMQKNNMISGLTERTEPEGYLLFWGAETALNFHTRRPSPTRYVYQYPLYKEGYVTEEKVCEFLDDILLNKPALIVDTGNPETPMFDFPVSSACITEKITQIRNQYRVTDPVDYMTAYRFVGE